MSYDKYESFSCRACYCQLSRIAIKGLVVSFDLPTLTPPPFVDKPGLPVTLATPQYKLAREIEVAEPVGLDCQLARFSASDVRISLAACF